MRSLTPVYIPALGDATAHDNNPINRVHTLVPPFAATFVTVTLAIYSLLLLYRRSFGATAITASIHPPKVVITYIYRGTHNTQ